MIQRYFRQISTDSWLARTDGNSPLSEPEALAHVADEYGLPAGDIAIVEVEDGPDPRSQPLTMPPDKPVRGLHPNDQLVADLNAATDIDGFRDALIKRFGA